MRKLFLYILVIGIIIYMIYQKRHQIFDKMSDIVYSL